MELEKGIRHAQNLIPFYEFYALSWPPLHNDTKRGITSENYLL